MAGKKLVRSALNGVPLTAKTGTADAKKYIKRQGYRDSQHHTEVMDTVHLAKYNGSTYWRAFGKEWNRFARKNKKAAKAKITNAKKDNSGRIVSGKISFK